MILYLDVSCLNRPFDDQSQSRIRLESEAVTLIFSLVEEGIHRMVSSEMAIIEIKAATDLERRRKVAALLPAKNDIIKLDSEIFHRAMRLERVGFKPADAVHVAAAEKLEADLLLSCDDQMCRAARRNASTLRVVVVNPLIWLKENPDA